MRLTYGIIFSSCIWFKSLYSNVGEINKSVGAKARNVFFCLAKASQTWNFWFLFIIWAILFSKQKLISLYDIMILPAFAIAHKLYVIFVSSLSFYVLRLLFAHFYLRRFNHYICYASLWVFVRTLYSIEWLINPFFVFNNRNISFHAFYIVYVLRM